MGRATLSVDQELEKSNDFTLECQVRSAIFHDLMDRAEADSDHDLWYKIGGAVIVAYQNDDLSAQVSDHFVRACPDDVFKDFAYIGPCDKYRNWKKRARQF
jgi:hypothetical protein